MKVHEFGGEKDVCVSVCVSVCVYHSFSKIRDSGAFEDIAGGLSNSVTRFELGKREQAVVSWDSMNESEGVVGYPNSVCFRR